MAAHYSKEFFQKLSHIAFDHLKDEKVEDLICHDVSQYSGLTDYVIICSSRSTRHAVGLSDKLTAEIKKHYDGNIRVEGKNSSNWILIDAAGIMIHIFSKEMREHYNMDQIIAESQNMHTPNAQQPDQQPAT